MENWANNLRDTDNTMRSSNSCYWIPRQKRENRVEAIFKDKMIENFQNWPNT